MSEKAWICEDCGAIATGDMCAACGRAVPVSIATPHQPGSYADILGWPKNTLAGEAHWGLVTIFMFILLAPALVFYDAGPYLAVICGLVAFRALVWPKLRSVLMTAWVRFRFRH